MKRRKKKHFKLHVNSRKRKKNKKKNMTQYQYDTNNMYLSQLAVEIKAEISKTVMKIETSDIVDGYLIITGDILRTGSSDIVFVSSPSKTNVILNNPLSISDKSSLDTIISSHIPNPNYPIPTGSL